MSAPNSRIGRWILAALGAIAFIVVGVTAIRSRVSIQSVPRQTVVIPDPNTEGSAPDLIRKFHDYRAAVAGNIDIAEPWGRFGMLCDAHALYGEAATCYRRANILAPDEFRWTYHLAHVRERMGAPANEVATLLQDAARLKPEYAPVYVRLGGVYSRAGEPEKARAALEQALRIDPKLTVAHRDLGQVLLSNGEVKQAVDHLQQALAGGVADRPTLAALSQAFQRLGLPDRARQAGASALQRTAFTQVADPMRAEVAELASSPTSVYSRAKGYLDAEDYPHAIRSFDQVMRLLPRDPYAPAWQAVAYIRLGKFTEGETSFRRAYRLRESLIDAPIALQRFDRLLWNFRIEYLGRVSRSGPESAIVRTLHEFEQAAATQPELLGARGYLTWGNAHSNLGRYEDGLTRYYDAVRIDPEFTDGHYNIGATLEDLGRPDEAIDHYRRVIQLDPNYAAATARLAALDAR